MAFLRRRARSPWEPCERAQPGAGSEGASARPFVGESPTSVSIAIGPLVGPVLRRVVGMLAARADLPLDRLDDAVLVADLIAARAPAHVTSERIDVALEPGAAPARAARRPAARGRRQGADRRRRGARRRQRDRAARGLAVEVTTDGPSRRVPERPPGLRRRRDLDLRRFRHVPRRGRVPVAMAIEFEIEDRRHARRTSSRSAARSICSPRPSSSSASRPRSTAGPSAWSST